MLKPAIRTMSTALLAALLLAGPVQAGRIDGQEFPDQITVGGKSLTLNGLGMRLATFFSIRVYAMGLYLETKTHSSADILGSVQNKRIVMKFVRDVEAGKLRDAWQEGFENNYSNVSSVQTPLDALKKAMPDMKDGDTMTFSFLSGDVSVSVNGTELGRFSGSEFEPALLSVWLGKEPPNEELKKGVLGLSE